MIIEIPAHVIRGAMKCQAKADVRHYLNAVLLNGDTGEIVGSDGHILFIAEVSDLKGAFSGSRILKIPQKIPRCVSDVDFDIERNIIAFKKYQWNKSTLETGLTRIGVELSCVEITAEYPDYSDLFDDTTPTAYQFSVKKRLLKRAIKALETPNYLGFTWTFFTKCAVMETFEDAYKRKVIIMPCMTTADEN